VDGLDAQLPRRRDVLICDLDALDARLVHVAVLAEERVVRERHELDQVLDVVAEQAGRHRVALVEAMPHAGLERLRALGFEVGIAAEAVAVGGVRGAEAGAARP